MNPYIYRCHKLKRFTDMLANKEPCLLSALGDSNTCNTNFTQGAKQWIEHLHSELRNHYNTQKVLLCNAGVSGDTILDGLKRFRSDVERFRPDCCIVAMGSNDAKRVSNQDFEAGLHRCIDRLETLGCSILVRTSTPVLEYEPQPGHIWQGASELCEKNAINLKVAEDRDLAAVDVYRYWADLEAAGMLDLGSLMHDAVHSNGRGHELVFRSIAGAFGLDARFSWEHTEATPPSE